MGLFDDLGHAVKSAAKAAGKALGKAGDAVVDAGKDALGWVRDTFGGGGAQAMPIDQAVLAMLNGKGSNGWREGAQAADELANAHDQLHTKVTDVISTLQNAWTGPSSEVALARMSPLLSVSQKAAGTYRGNGGEVVGVAEHYDYTQRQLVPMQNPPPEKGFFDKASPWNTDTEKQINAWNATAKENLEKYNAYADMANNSISKLDVDHGQLGAYNGGDASLAPSPVSPPPPGKGRDQQFGRQDTSGQDHNTSTITPPGVTPPPSTVQPGGHDTSGTGGFPQHNTPGGLGDNTRAAAYVPPGSTPGNFPPGSNFFPGGITPGAGPGSGSNPTPYVGGVGYLDGPGAGKGVDGAGRSGGGLPGGKQTGVRGPIEEPGLRGGPGASGRAGSRLTGGPGGMAPGARKGESEEDAEHRRKYGLDDDSLFTDEERTIDPVTGFPVAPPTIGA
ncbi:WXG100 family type VII secretion target [Amycolatopsis sp. H20-H5]|uniref:WXG100 family type VII secretion target n=1 Tax=Amycolatopsis sp. H20-H5 TaxID=3046309 RepID=UPI002DBF78F5|nr:PPE domain-containing protein [Amycolatopsis sp. H20-H5]MEC3977182.1 PPE domain-containing protein [Amycolatopsis sp. H20-H5]